MQETASRKTAAHCSVKWRRCDAQISKAVLGQTMTTDNGSSRSQADVHNQVRMDIVRWDARQLANTLNEYGAALHRGQLRATGALPPCCSAYSEAEDLKALTDAWCR
nr:DUF935 family protein [Shigella boydii]